MHVEIMAYEGCVASGVNGFGDTFAVANHLAGEQLFSVKTVSHEGKAVQPFSGPMMNVEGGLTERGNGVLFVPPAVGVGELQTELVEHVRNKHDEGAVICAACFGVFLPAEAGILDGRTATTHWALAEEFARRFPDIRLERDRMIIDHGDVICAGGLTAYFDLALHLISRFASPALSAECARTMLLDSGRTDQTPYACLTASTDHGDPLITKAQKWLEDNHTRPLRIRDMAEALHTGERTLLRRFKKVLNRTPARCLQALRIEHAKRLLESRTDSVDDIVEKIGYRDTPAFFRLFKEMTGLTPGEYRARFGMGKSTPSF